MNSNLHTVPTESAQIERHDLLSRVTRVVVKVGSRVISQNYNLNPSSLDRLVDDLATVKHKGIEVILVSSGAIAAGTGKLFGQRPQTIPGLQAAAAVGQSHLIHAYDQRFQRHDLITAMMLLTQDDFSYRERYTHISDALGTLLQLGVIPIINENDSVAVEEIKFGDNDTLSAQVTNIAEADLLIILSDQDGFHTQDPRKYSNAEFISVVPAITDTLQRSAGGAGSADGTGGMITKLRAAEIVTGSGEIMVLANGNQPAVVSRILAGEEIGTLFLPQQRISARKRWIAYSRLPRGTLYVDNGARDTLKQRGKSLLPSGLRKVEGDFEYGDTLSCIDENGSEFARGLANYNKQEVVQIMGKQTSEIKKILGYHHYDEVIHRDNLVLLKEA